MPILNFNFSMIPSFPICKTLDLHNYIDFKTATPSAILINFKKTENLALAMLLEDRLKSLNRGRSIHSKKNLQWNSKAEPSAICQYVCQSFLFVQPIKS